jgi:hypothetical protein
MTEEITMSQELKIRKASYLLRIPVIPFNKMERSEVVEVPLKKESDIKTVRQRIYRFQQKSPKRFSCYKLDPYTAIVSRVK